MNFHAEHAAAVLSQTPQVLTALLHDLPEEWHHVKETDKEDSWSPFDIVAHLIHGEKTDWIPRMQILLSGNESREFVPFDMKAHFKESEGKTLRELLKEFDGLRKGNIGQLRAARLTKRDLDQTGIHPELGTVTLRQHLSTWVVLDFSHLAQISRVLAKQYKEEIGPWIRFHPILSR